MELIGIVRVYQGVQFFNWPRLQHLTGFGLLAWYYTIKPKELGNWRLSDIIIGVPIDVITTVVSHLCLRQLLSIESSRSENLRQALQNEYTQSVFSILWVIGEDAILLPNYLYWKRFVFPIKVITSLIFGLMHYPGGCYSLASCLAKSISVYVNLHFHRCITSLILVHLLIDICLLKMMF